MATRIPSAIPMTRTLVPTLAVAFLAGSAHAADPLQPPNPKVVIPFDFESQFDHGVYGQTIGDMLWAKLKREGGFILPESMQDVRDWCQRTRTQPNPDMPLDRLKTIVVDEQAGDIGIWGKVERVQGFDSDVYDLWIIVADFSVKPPKVLYTTKARTKTVSEIPHVYIKEALDRLYGRTGERDTPAVFDPAIAERWNHGPNLVRGDFETGADHPQGWDPLPAGVTWVTAKKDQSAEETGARIIRFQFGKEVAGSTGVLYYSDYFPVEAGSTYRFQCLWRSSGSAAKVFIKCYDEVPGGIEGGVARREVYRSQQNLTGPNGQWNLQTEDFTPKHPRFNPRWGRVMLYGYWPAGTVEWDDVVVKLVKPALSSSPGR
jgi:hypothetical protein